MKRILFAALFLFATQARAEFKVPSMPETTLDNGLRLIFIPQHEVPLVNVTVVVRAGSVLDGEAWGLASLSSGAIDLGTKSFSKKDIEDTFDQNGFSLETGVSKEYLTIDVASAKEDTETLLRYLSEMVRVPTYPETEVTKLRDRSVSQLRKEKESPNQIASAVFDRLYFKSHPYGHPDNGVVGTLQKLKSKDLKAFHKAYFQPQISAVVVSGDFEVEAMKAQLVKAFGTWAKGSAKPAEIKTVADAPKDAQLLLLDKPDARETTLRIGGKGVPNLNPEWPKLAVVNTILGGRFTSLLNDALRVKSGYTYGARSRFNEYRSDGSFVISTFTANETTFKALDLALETYKSFLEKGVDQKTLDSAKAYVKGQFPPQYETLASLNALAAELWVYGVSLDSFNRFESEVNALSVSEANQLIKTRFPHDNLQILLIGKASEIAKNAKTYGRFRQLPLAKLDSSEPL